MSTGLASNVPALDKAASGVTFFLGILLSLLPDAKLHLEAEVGDGNCFFRAIARQVHGDPSLYAQVRGEICDCMAARPELLGWLLQVQPDTGAWAIADYVENMRTEGTFGGLEEALYAQLCYSRNVNIYVMEDSARQSSLCRLDTKQQCTMKFAGLPPLSAALQGALFPAARRAEIRLVMYTSGYHWDSLLPGTVPAGAR